jgi:hypothetical protein
MAAKMHPRGLAFGFLVAFALAALPLSAAPQPGKLMGVVVADGTPQLGATVMIAAEQVRGSAPLQLLTNERGVFRSDALLPGFYSVRVSLAGFLPTMEQHISIDARRTTLVKIELDSVFSSLDRLRRRPDQKLDSDEWAWVLRTSAATRPVLRWSDGEVVIGQDPSQAEAAKKNRSRGRVELTSGARHPGSVSNLSDSPATAFAYEQTIGSVSRLLMAGQVSYERTAAAGFATTWLPAGDASRGPATSLVLRQAKLGPEGPTFRGVLMEQDDQAALGDRVTLQYGGEFVMMGVGRSTSSLRPHAVLGLSLARSWRTSLTLATRPRPAADQDTPDSSLRAALDELDAFPTLLMRNGRPVLDRDWHEELSLEHSLGPNSSLVAAVFQDRSRHTSLFGRGNMTNADFFQDFFSDAFAYDGGSSSLWGTRVAFQKKFAQNFATALVYAWAGALAADDVAANQNLRDALRTRYCHSLAARVSGRLPRWGTRFATGYRWIDGAVVTRPDAYGDALYQMDPYFSLSFRQPLPSFICCRVELIGDFRNLLAQGYVPVSTRDGRALLIPTARSFRGGFSVQF